MSTIERPKSPLPRRNIAQTPLGRPVYAPRHADAAIAGFLRGLRLEQGARAVRV